MSEKISEVTIAYFSGTGCTKMAADGFEKRLTALKIHTDMRDIAEEPSYRSKDSPQADLLMVLSPVYAFRLAENVERWVKKLPPGKGTRCAVISVSGGGEVSPNTACRVAVKRRLQKNGYPVVYENMIVLPSNIFVSTEGTLAAELIRVLPRKLDSMLSELLAGRRKLLRPKPLDRLLAPFGKMEHIGAKLFGAQIHASNDCVQCGLCIKNCPQKNIRLLSGKIKFGYRCILCMRCLYGCPKRALSPRLMKSFVLKDGFCLDTIRETAEMSACGKCGDLSKDFLWKGVYQYLRC